MNNLSEKIEKVPQKGTKRVRKGKSKLTHLNPLTLWKFVYCLNSMSSKFRVEYGSMQLLCLLYWLWEENRKGVTVYGIIQYVDWYNTGRVSVLVNQRLAVLMNRGLVEIVGEGRWNAKLYAPTVGAMRDMIEIIAKMEE